jgi:hypothetical protein
MITAVASRIYGIFQVRRTSDSWTVTPVIYGSGTTYLPKEMNARDAINLFTVCRLPKASLAQDSFIAELDTEVSAKQLTEFGFETLARV